jgi:phosphatidylinositol phospholipase C delta
VSPPISVPIEAIKEIRSGPDARYDREQFRVAEECEKRWLTIIYILDGNYKTLHMIAPTEEIFHMWDTALRKLHAIRQVLMSGLGHLEMRDKLWENQYWKGADQIPDKKLDFPEVERICRRLNNNLSFEELNRIFKVNFFSLPSLA